MVNIGYSVPHSDCSAMSKMSNQKTKFMEDACMLTGALPYSCVNDSFSDG